MRRGDRALGDGALSSAGAETWGVLATVDEAAQPCSVPVNYAYDGAGHPLRRAGGTPARQRACTPAGQLHGGWTCRTEPQHFTTAYESVIAFGRVRGSRVRRSVPPCVQLAERLGPDDPRARDSYIDAGLERVAVLRFEIERLTGKARAGEQDTHGQES